MKALQVKDRTGLWRIGNTKVFVERRYSTNYYAGHGPTFKANYFITVAGELIATETSKHRAITKAKKLAENKGDRQ